MGFQTIAYRGLETGSRDMVSYVLNQGHINLIITSPLIKNTDIGAHIDIHGDGVKDVAFTVDDAEIAWKIMQLKKPDFFILTFDDSFN